MLIGIIVGNNLRITPYAFYYTTILDELGIEYELVMPDRNKHLKYNDSHVVQVIPWEDESNVVSNYLRYARALKKLTLSRYDFLIIPDTTVSVFSSYWLKKYFDKRYIIDIRDYTHEKNPVYFQLEKIALSHALARVVSSPKYTSFLPKGEYLICHNINTPQEKSRYKFKKASKEIVIGYVGALSYIEQCKAIMRLVATDARFKLVFYGTGIADAGISDYMEKLGCSRISKYGSYVASDKGKIIEQIDILFNAYGSGYPLVDTALSNKLYDAMYYHKPLITSPNTYMAECAGMLSFPMELKEINELDKLWDWYNELNPNQVDDFADNVYSSLVIEHNNTKKEIQHLLLDYIRK